MALQTMIIAVTAGVVSHLAFFNRGEHHMHGPTYLRLFLSLYAIAIPVDININGESLGQAFGNISSLASCYLLGVFASLLAYRLFFNPLKRFPGPYGARVSNFWFASQLANHDGYKKVYELHQKYGDFLRIGSNDLSIIHPKAVNAIYGHGSKCRKADWYDLNKPRISVLTIRDRTNHDKRRRVWSAAFGDKALRGYEERIKVYQDQLVAQIGKFGDQAINFTKWSNLYNFDVMGDLAFGKSFDMLLSSEEHWAVKLLNEGIMPLGYYLPTWFFRQMTAVPKLMDDWWKFINFCVQKLEERMNTKVDTPDIMSTLLAPHKDSQPTKAELQMLRGDSQLVIVAGSDTTAAALTFIFYQLARNPEHISKVREEIIPCITAQGDVSDQKLQYLDHLNAVIHETLRLHPSVPTAITRLTPPEGLEIGDQYIPGNTTVWCPQWAIGRSEKVYTNASEFIPERWYSHPEMIKERSAYAPFSAGPQNCIGRPLAMLNMRTTIARLLLAFDIGFAPGYTAAGFEDRARDHFTVAPGDLEIVFRKRGGGVSL